MDQKRWARRTKAWRGAHPEEKPKPKQALRHPGHQFRPPEKWEVPMVRIWELEEWQIARPEAQAEWLKDRRLYALVVFEEFVLGIEVPDYMARAHKERRGPLSKKAAELLAGVEDLLRLPMSKLKRALVERWAEGGHLNELMELRIDTCDDPRYRGVRNTAASVGLLPDERVVLGTSRDLADRK